jgi:hypothetical protein
VRMAFRQTLAIAVAALVPTGSVLGVEPVDPYFGEALYHAHQGLHFEALERLDTEIRQHHGVDEPELDSLYAHIDQAEFSVGDFELRYRMHHRAGRAIRAVLEADVEATVRNEAAFRLARIHFEKDQPEAALGVLDGMDGPIPEEIRDDVAFLRANVYLALELPAQAATVLEELQSSKELKGFARYNLGIARLQEGLQPEALKELDRAGRVTGDDRETQAIRDKSNLVLGTLLFEASEFGLAQQSLDRVRIEGPFSNQALLRSGWADASAENFERALIPWGILAERDPTDAAVQEAILALPYAYGQLDVHGRAAILYGNAVETFSAELQKLDSSIQNIRMGEFLDALAQEEIRQDKDWVVRLRSLPEAPETFYLLTLMASHEFQTALQNYLDLEDLRAKLVSWLTSLDSFEEVIALRQAYYEPLLPAIDAQFRKLDAQVKLRFEQRKHVEERLNNMLIVPRPDYLAASSEQQTKARLEELEAATPVEDEALRQRIARLRGVLVWQIETEYPERLTEAHTHLRELNADIDTLTTQYDAFVRTRQAATHSYVGYDVPVKRLRTRVGDAQERLKRLMAQQGHVLESVAIAELTGRRDRLMTYQNQARFAFADSYDRAAKSQAH